MDSNRRKNLKEQQGVSKGTTGQELPGPILGHERDADKASLSEGGETLGLDLVEERQNRKSTA